MVTVITGAHRVVRALAGASNASPTLSLPPSLSRAMSTNNECAATTKMADAKGADAAMADVPLYFDPHHFYLSTVFGSIVDRSMLVLSDSCDMIGLAVLRVRQAEAEAEAEVVERLPTPGGMSSPSVFGSPPPVGSGTGLAMPADERFQQQKLRLVRAATSTISTVRAQSASAKTRTALMPRMPLSLTCCDASAWTCAAHSR